MAGDICQMLRIVNAEKATTTQFLPRKTIWFQLHTKSTKYTIPAESED